MSSSDHPLALFLREIRRHRDLDQADRDAILNMPLRVRKPDAGTYLVREGNMPEQ